MPRKGAQVHVHVQRHPASCAAIGIQGGIIHARRAGLAAGARHAGLGQRVDDAPLEQRDIPLTYMSTRRRSNSA